jgi:hypothetical protein
VNPDKARYDGILLPFCINDFMKGVENVLTGLYRANTVRFAEARLNDGQRILAFNDLFIGAISHISARYKISFDKRSEEHSSSGLIVSTQAGSTGWLSSVFNMAEGVLRVSGKNMDVLQPEIKSHELFFVVREPFQSLRTQTGITAGIITEHRRLVIESLMPSAGIIFSDGIETDFLRFNSGSIVTIGIAAEKATLVLN